ncbi:hypothetical protein IB236_19755 [Acidovorax sp. ACV02]|uniref:glycosyltransferase family 32 protein n=1 Tax=Acidovorax sp. ACV02 TaxID=2769310 RepID=UPI0017822F24|nr:glycosyltransferase [Acidovorax sp. ACV02]MBD9407581.1 hypothetical protein [Acidovorax sp. ACV02]
MLLTSIFLSPSGLPDGEPLPPLILENIRSFRKRHPRIPHKLFGQAELTAFIEQKFSSEVVNAFVQLKPLAYKADLARYCVMYEHGGVYADLSYYFLRSLPVDAHRVTVFRDFMWSSPWDTSNGVFSAPPKHKVFEAAIQMICANVRRGYYGNTPLCPTGPALFGKALAMVCEPQDLVTGVAGMVGKDLVARAARDIDLPTDEKAHCLILRDGIVAVKRKRMGSPGLLDFGVAGGSGYSDLWRRRDIYATDVDAPAGFDVGRSAQDEEFRDDHGVSMPWSVADWFDTAPRASPGLLHRLIAKLRR